VDKKELLDQFLHTLSGFLLSLVPFVGAFFFAVSREYYQAKITMTHVLNREPTFLEVMEIVDLGKKDLLYGYLGIILAVGTLYFAFHSFYSVI
jgi:hypothetical protein